MLLTILSRSLFGFYYIDHIVKISLIEWLQTSLYFSIAIQIATSSVKSKLQVQLIIFFLMDSRVNYLSLIFLPYEAYVIDVFIFLIYVANSNF
jgi:hypothetical protein